MDKIFRYFTIIFLIFPFYCSYVKANPTMYDKTEISKSFSSNENEENKYWQYFSTLKFKDKVVELQKKMVRDNKVLPQMIADDVQLSSVSSKDLTISSVMKLFGVNTNSNNISKMIKTICPIYKKNMCNSSIQRNMLYVGLKYNVLFYDRNNTYIGSCLVSEKDC